MKKSLVALLLASIISTFGLSTTVQANHAGGYKINLKRLYSWGNGRNPENNTNNFLETTGGTILFFNPLIRKRLLAVMANQVESFKSNFLIFDPSTRQSRMAALTVSKSANTLLVGHYLVKHSEIDRAMLSPDWATVSAFCKTLYKNTDPRNIKFGCDGVWASGITKLPNGQFLITGGTIAVVYDDKASVDASCDIPRTAIVYDVQSNAIVKSFKLCQRRCGHFSLMLPDGKVLLVGDSVQPGEPTSIEIVDPAAGTSRLLACQSKDHSFRTVCVDSQGNCLLLGGIDSRVNSNGLVERININQETLEEIGDLGLPRSNGSAITLPDHCILISGGQIIKADAETDQFRKDAEIILLDK